MSVYTSTDRATPGCAQPLAFTSRGWDRTVRQAVVHPLDQHPAEPLRRPQRLLERGQFTEPLPVPALFGQRQPGQLKASGVQPGRRGGIAAGLPVVGGAAQEAGEEPRIEGRRIGAQQLEVAAERGARVPLADDPDDGPAAEHGHVRKTGDTVYTKLDEALLREQSKGEPKADVDAAVELIAGRWMESKASDPDTEDSIEFCDLKGLLKEFEAGDNAARKKGPTKVAGKPALRLTEKEGAETFTIDVSAEGAPYILRVASRGGEEPMTMNLSEFDVPVVAEKPAAKDIVDLEP